MLSILIPIYNQEVTVLVNDLHRLGQSYGKDFEIILADDGSDPQWAKINQPLQSLTFVKYFSLPKNIGRSAIRNFLSENARYEYLLFMDGDMKVIADDFVEKYVAATHPEKVVVGGLSYQKEKPTKDKLLHWKVGMHREVRSDSERQEAPYDSFLSSNFMVPKSIFQSIQFDSRLTQYGHEDTLFGMQLRERGIEISHIDNPLEHAGLESTGVFLDKTKKAIENLVYLRQNGVEIDTKLVATYLKIRKLGLSLVVGFIFDLLENTIQKNLKSDNPNLRLFDLFKMNALIDISRKGKLD